MSLAFSPNNQHVISGSRDKTLRIWDLESGEPVGEPLVGHGDSVTAVAFSGDGRKIASSSDDPLVCIWDAKTRQQIGKPIEVSEWVFSLDFSFDGSTVILGCLDSLQGWNIDRQTLRWQVDIPAYSFAITPDNTQIVCSGFDGVHIINIPTSDMQKVAASPSPANLGEIQAIAFSLDGSRVVTVSDYDAFFG